MSPSVVLVFISQYRFLHPRSGVNSGLTPPPCQHGFPVPYRLLQVIHFGPVLEGRVSVLLFKHKTPVMCQAVSASASQCTGISSLLCGPTPHSLSHWELQSGSTASPTQVSRSFLILRVRGFYFPPFNLSIYSKTEYIFQYLYRVEETDNFSNRLCLPPWQMFLPWFSCIVYIFLGVSM